MDVRDDDDIGLSVETLKILNEFIQEKAERKLKEREQILGKADIDVDFTEDWQLSQFWYSKATKEILREVVKKLVSEQGPNYSIALLSCPSLYKPIKEIHDSVKIFEFDERFAAFGRDFIFYNFNQAFKEDYLKDLQDTFDVIIADPPFLSKECITKMAKIVKKIGKPDAKIIFCSGEIVESWLTSALCLKKCNFRPEHERNLGNEFVSYANFELDDFLCTNINL